MHRIFLCACHPPSAAQLPWRRPHHQRWQPVTPTRGGLVAGCLARPQHAPRGLRQRGCATEAAVRRGGLRLEAEPGLEQQPGTRLQGRGRQARRRRAQLALPVTGAGQPHQRRAPVMFLGLPAAKKE